MQKREQTNKRIKEYKGTGIKTTYVHAKKCKCKASKFKQLDHI